MLRRTQLLRESDALSSSKTPNGAVQESHAKRQGGNDELSKKRVRVASRPFARGLRHRFGELPFPQPYSAYFPLWRSDPLLQRLGPGADEFSAQFIRVGKGNGRH